MKKYKFDLTKYFDDNELESIALILDDFLGSFADDNGNATLDIKDDIHVTMKSGEGAVFHLVLDNDELFTALPKKLSQPKKIASFVISKMEDAVKKTTAAANAVQAKADLEAKAEDDLLGYMGADSQEDASTHTSVKVNGKPVVDPDEKQRIINGLKDDYKKFAESFKSAFNRFQDTDFVSDFFSAFLG